MTALINQELAKIEKADRAYGKSADPAMDAFSEAWKMGQEQKMWNERKNFQRQQMMSEFAKDTRRLYNNEDAKIYKDRFQKYFDRHKDSMDESTLEMGQMYLSNFDFQMKKNDSFNQYEARQDEEMKKVTDFTNKFEIGKEYTDEDLEEFRKVVTGYTDYTEEFAKNHADRLELKSNQHINRNLAHGSYVNDYVLDSFFDDKKIDKVEYKAYKESIARNSIQPIKDYNDYQSSLIKTSSKALVEEIEGNVQLFKNFKSIYNNEIPVPKEYVPGEQTGLFYKDLESDTQKAINAQIFKLGADITLGDKTHTDRHGTSYVDYQHKGLFGVKTPSGGGGGSKELAKSEDEYTVGVPEKKKSIIKELPVSALSAWGSWQGASSSAKAGGMSEFFDRDDIIDKPKSGGGTKSVLEFDASNLLSAYESRATKESVRKQLTEDSPIVRDLAKESGIKAKYVVDVLEPKRKELAKSKKYIVDVPEKKKPTEIKIKRDNKAIKDLAKKLNLKGNYMSFSNNIIKAWESLKAEEKSRYNSFEDWVEKTLMSKEVEQEISIVR